MGATVGECASDRRAVMACEVNAGSLDSRIATFQTDDHKLRVSTKHADHYLVNAVWRGQIFVTSPKYDGEEYTYIVDRSANRLGDKVPVGFLRAIIDRYAAFVSKDSYGVYRVTS